MRITFLMVFLAFPALGQIDIDNTCATCGRRSLDSLNLEVRNARVNQIGYRTSDPHKLAYFANPTGNSFSIVHAETHATVYTGTLQTLGNHTGGGMHIEGYFNSITPLYSLDRAPVMETLYYGDFSEVQTPGSYYAVSGSDTSAIFRIDARIYNQVFETSLQFFGVNRCGDTDSWIHEECHLQDGSALGAAQAGALSGGWHDCGDHGKYSETVGYAALVLSLTYAIWPEKAEDFYGSSYNDTLPFGTDGIPDLLWEAKVGVDYIYKLYAASKQAGLIDNGDMYHSVGTGPGQDHEYWDVPENQDQQPQSKGGPPRPVTAGIGSNVAGMFAASMAYFAWGWEVYDPIYAAQLRDAAIDVYDNIIMPRLNTTTTMPCCYPGGGLTHDDEAMAALALWFLTKDERYRYDLLDNTDLNNNPTAVFNQGEFPAGHMGRVPFHHGGWTTDYEQVNAFVLFGLAKLILPDAATAAEHGVEAAVRDSLMVDIIENLRQSIRIGSNGSNSTSWPGINVDEPYHGVFTSVDWGYNRYNFGMVNELYMMWDLTGEEHYYEIGMDNMNYNMGMNPWDISFLMGTGDKNLQHPHNRASNPEGYNAGGIPYEYTVPKGAFMGGARPGETLIDVWKDYVNTETCIDFSAQLILPAQMLAEDLPPDVVGPALISVNTFPEDVRATITWTLNELSRDTLVVLTVDGDTVEVVSPDGLDRSKSVLVENLNPNTTYYFYIKSRDVRNNISIHDNNGNMYHFTTTTTPITPDISNVRVCNVDHESAQVTWWTLNGPSTSRVEYGTTPDLGLVKDGDDSGFPTLFHSVTLQQLTPTTLYYFDVLSNSVRDDNGGDHYQFTTSEVLVDYTVQLKPIKNDGTMFYMQITNNEDQGYTGLELRFYFEHDDPAEVANWQLISDYSVRCNVGGCVGDPLDLSIGSAVGLPGHPGVYYFPITIGATLGVADRGLMQLKVVGLNNTPVALNNFNDAWSFRAHTDPPDPAAFDGIDLSKGGPNGVYETDAMVETINGVPEVTYTTTEYVTAYYNGVHVYGYGPDYEEDVLQVRRSVTLNITDPQVTGPATQVNVQRQDSNYVISGDAFSTPDGEITNIIVNGQVLPDSQVTSTSDTSVSFVHPVILQPGTNTYDIVAWDDANCAFQSQKVVVNWIVAPPQQVATPQATTEPAGNVFNTTMTIWLITETPNAEILYTLDGSDPAGGTVYDPNNPIVISDTTQVWAIAIRDGWVNSAQLDTTFYRVVNQVTAPTADPSGTSFSTTLTVFLSTTTDEATILYTLDGNNPDPAGGGNTQTYDPDAGIDLEATTTIKAIAVRDGWVPSTVTTESYVYDPFKVSLPTADPFEDPVYIFTGTSADASLDVILSVATDSATILYTLDGSDPATTVGGSTNEYTGPITLNATTTIKAIAVRPDWTPSDVLVANYEKVIVLPDALSARMLDLDGDGRAETVHVTFAEAVAALPNAITSVSWPAEGDEDKDAGASQLSLLSDNIIAIDFSGDPFGFGLTAAGGPAPSLTLPGGVEVPIEDGVGPVITEASMRPPEIKQYVLESDDPQTIRQFPDTLVLQLSEPLVDVNGVAQPWSDFLQYSRSCVVEEPGTNVLVTAQPIVDPADPTVWKLPVESDVLGSRVRAGNCVWLNGEGEYGDLAGNRPSEVPVVVTGSGSQSFDNFYTSLLVPIVGDPSQSDTIRLPLSGEIAVLDDAGNVTRYTKINDGTEWIPPLYMTDEGRINERGAAECDPGARRTDIEPESFPPNCLSGIGVYSDGPYTAQVMIVDHLGKFIHSSTQSFGFCGELENEDRWRPGGYASFLIWNQKDDRGEYVASGVYLWKITYRLQGGKTRTELYKQGIVRGATPDPLCAVE